MHCRISPRKTCNPCGCTVKISSRYHRLLIYDGKRTTKIDGMGTFKTSIPLATDLCLSWPKVLNLVTVRASLKTPV